MKMRESALNEENEGLRRQVAVREERQGVNAVEGRKRSRADGEEEEGEEGREEGKRRKEYDPSGR